jgi:thymidylate synthase (FAD)
VENEIAVLDRGFVRLESHMGGDQAVLRAARVSRKSESLDEARDRKLVAYLLAHQHGTPFEHAVFTFHVKLPMFVARQWIRHRMSSYNETSFRYREPPDEFYYPDRWRAQDTKNRQGSVELNSSHHERLTEMVKSGDAMAIQKYKLLINAGVSRELARIVLPVNIYTEWYWTVNARALMHFIGLRSEAHAQWEIQQYSDALYKFFAQEMPWTAGAFLATLDKSRYGICAEGGLNSV